MICISDYCYCISSFLWIFFLLNSFRYKPAEYYVPQKQHFGNTCRPPVFCLLHPTFSAKQAWPVILIITVTRIILKNCRLCVLSHARNLKWTSAQATSEWVVLHTGQGLGLALGEAVRFQVSPQWKSQWNKKCWNEHHSETLPLHQSSILHGLATN